ncbi:hypothetical protein [Chondromyces apiculatus]|uniref:Lipid/polyisoprenoid-binding YceI-like domain-containing protein n=1 Tax=Chondromyces apiculatus DSM 436 TaxID=1192034 RepID=A0A017T4J1_9BACT|nr:hypothetical protein [Chondromyces apiculatus]EYF03486.1 Hypothetical protein CAP_5470 [Chondromyces apiculatus DSM 436]
MASVAELNLDPAASRLRLRTRAAGVLARLAHDLEITAKGMRAQAHLDGEAWTAEVFITVADLEVAGTLRGDRLDPGGLSTSDRREIERRLRVDALRSTGEVRIQASGKTRARAEGRVEIQGATATFSAALTTREDARGAVTVSGTCILSLKALKIAEIKGPLGAFKIRDEVEVLFDLTLRPNA